MGQLKDRMIEYMRLRNFADNTITAYLYHLREYVKMFRKSPDLLGEEEVRRYLYHLRNTKKTSWSNINIAYSALKFFYVDTLYREWHVRKIPRPKGERRLPVVFSHQEVKRLFDVAENLRQRVILETIYSGGLRVSEAAHLKVSDIDSDRMQIRVAQGKGNKDRYTLLAKSALVDLREYWRAYRPTSWLFFGRDKQKPLTPRGIQWNFKAAKKKPASTSLLRFIPYAILLQLTCLSRAWICLPSKNCSATQASKRP
jgi:site-specific recombinase XerD